MKIIGALYLSLVGGLFACGTSATISYVTHDQNKTYAVQYFQVSDQNSANAWMPLIALIDDGKFTTAAPLNAMPCLSAPQFTVLSGTPIAKNEKFELHQLAPGGGKECLLDYTIARNSGGGLSVKATWMALKGDDTSAYTVKGTSEVDLEPITQNKFLTALRAATASPTSSDGALNLLNWRSPNGGLSEPSCEMVFGSACADLDSQLDNKKSH